MADKQEGDAAILMNGSEKDLNNAFKGLFYGFQGSALLDIFRNCVKYQSYTGKPTDTK